MGSNEQLVPTEESNLKLEAPKQAEKSASTKKCDSLVPLASISSAELPTGCGEQLVQTNTSVPVLEASNEDPKLPSLEECSSFVMEIPALDSLADPLGGNDEAVERSDREQQSCWVVNNSLGPEEIPVDGCVVTDQDAIIAASCRADTENKVATIDSLGDLENDPEFEKLSEVECAASVEDLQFSGPDGLSNTLGESLAPSHEHSFSSAATGVEEDGLYFINISVSVEGNTKSALDLNDADKDLNVDQYKSTNSLPNSSTEWCKETGSGHTDVPLLEINSENSAKDHCVLGDHCLPGQDQVLSVGNAFPLERSTLLPEQVNGKLSISVKQADSFHFSDPAIVLGSDSPSGQFRQESFKLNGIQQGNNSAAMAEISCFTDERTGNVHIVDPEALESNGALSLLRRSSRDKKIFQEGSNKKYTRKGSKKALNRTTDLLSAAVKSKRSCSNRSARISRWGLIDSLSKYIKLNAGVVDPGSGMVKRTGKSRKKEKVHVDTSSYGVNSKARNHASSGQVSLKLKLVRKGKNAIQSTPLPGIKVNPSNESGDNQLHLSNCLKDDNEESSIKSRERVSDVKLEKSATVLQNSVVAADFVDKNLEVNLMPAKFSSIGGSILSDAQKSGGSADDRHLNSGTSPDSEVIHAPNPQFASKELMVHHNDGIDSFNSTQIPAENGHLTMAKMRRKKGKKGQICQLGDSDAQNRLLISSIIEKTEITENYGENDTKSHMAARLGARHESADSWNCTKVLSSGEAKGSKKSKGLKLEKTKVKSKPVNAPRLKMADSRKGKVDKWKLVGKHSINESGISDLSHRKEDESEAAGNHGTDDCGNNTNITMKGGVYEGVTSLSVIPGGAGQQRMQLRTAWVCCDDCLKWRCIPANLADTIDETNCRWTCKDNQDKAFADCSVPQEKSNTEINAELNISDDEDGFDVHLSGKYYSLKHSAVPQQSSWMLIKSNIFLHRSRYTQTLDEIMVCHCKSSREGKLGCGDECLNRMLNIECVHGTCPCGDLCSNQQFQRQSYANLKWFRSGKKGYGLQVQEDISEGNFLIEYVGEVLDLAAYEARQREYASKGHKHFYFMTLNGSEVIDACAKGNLGRFINHSCDPNCRTEKWMVNGEICIGLFAVRDIKKGEELTFDYNYVRVFGAAAKRCYCGSPQCRGYIGGDRLNNEVVVQSDSDEDFPEPVVVYENGEIADDLNMMSESNSVDAIMEKKDDTLLQSDSDILIDGKDLANNLEESSTSVDAQLHSIAEKNTMRSYISESENVDNSTLNVHQDSAINRTSVSMASPKRSNSLSLKIPHPESLSESADPGIIKSATEIISGKAAQSKGRPRMKISRPSKSGKSKESNDCRSGDIADYSLVIPKKSQPTPTKLKKLVESSAKPHFETVEEKLNELLDDAGGICKRKDAFKGYLKLLVLTAASGDCNHHETIQSNKDLSMILDAILKTKSRTVLTDILNKNGLQMLHSMMKKCRGNFNMIPILRKLLKVFEFLVERKILKLEHINGDPPRPGVESFRDSILKLTEHEDRKVHQIARNFRDRWIPRPFKKFNCMDKGDWTTDVKRTLNGSMFANSTYSMKQQSLPPGHLVDSEGSSHFGECITSTRVNGKRKSRWDQSPGSVSPGVNKEQKTAEDLHTSTHHFKKDEEMQEFEDDAPPGFSCPSAIPISQQYPGPLKCPSQIPMGFAQERFNSGLPVAYGIPFNLVQEFGTPQASTADGWVIAPGMPFRPFPPLPLCPRKGQNGETPSGSTQTVSSDRGGSCDPERRHFKPNEFRKPPWGFNRNGIESGSNFSQRRLSGVVMGAVVDDRNEQPENVNNYGVEFAGNSG